MKTDPQIKADVGAELAWDPAVNPITIGVAARDGIVTLSGTVDTYLHKHSVEHAVRRVSGVRGIAQDLEARLAPGHARTDAEIAQAAAHALRWHSFVPHEKVTVEVDDGWVRLSGEVDWTYQYASAEQAVRPLIGVKGVRNEIHLKQRANPVELRADLIAASTRHAEPGANHIAIEGDGGEVKLRGNVDTLAERDTAIGTAYAAEGVTSVVNRLQVGA